MSPPVRIGFVGKAGSGKTTMADYCTGRYGCRMVSLAEPVKQIAEVKNTVSEHRWASVLYEMAYDLLDGGLDYGQRVLKARNLAVQWAGDLRESSNRRELLQRIGTDSGRGVDPEIWVNKAEQKILSAGNITPLVVDDVRFINEAEMLKQQGFKIVRLNVPAVVRAMRLDERDGTSQGMPVSESNHPSETEQDQIEVDYGLDNSDEGPDLAYRQLKLLLAGRLGRKESKMTVNEIKLKKDEPPTIEKAFEVAASALFGTPLENFEYQVTKYGDGSYGHEFKVMTEVPE